MANPSLLFPAFQSRSHPGGPNKKQIQKAQNYDYKSNPIHAFRLTPPEFCENNARCRRQRARGRRRKAATSSPFGRGPRGKAATSSPFARAHRAKGLRALALAWTKTGLRPAALVGSRTAIDLAKGGASPGSKLTNCANLGLRPAVISAGALPVDRSAILRRRHCCPGFQSSERAAG